MAAGTRMERQMSDWQPDPANPLWWDDYTAPAHLVRPLTGTRWRHWKLGAVVITREPHGELDEVEAHQVGDVTGRVHVVKIRSLVEQL